ncbi:hypothetical protein FF36_04675 [Frankia torreyi]|uniref:Uncharacterized protein n=1 Tax=Frankia torreyi TaxID=1856 RepID=A0A0D8BAL2_9ACTN|nr:MULTISPECIES: nuclear transport factor 2 family protein [Frankia]KJE20994.1 hypothetical protein FF36_04675 [Frankia torreyi]KQM03891.1 hypothetical protein FF86_103337 [Frankia sp. CpI1-P]
MIPPVPAHDGDRPGDLPDLTRTPRSGVDLVGTLLSAWTETNPLRREAALTASCTPDVRYTNPIGQAQGRPAVAELLGRIARSYPTLRPVRISAIDLHHGYGRFEWAMCLPNGHRVLEGLDVITLSADESRIAEVVAFFGPTDRTTTYTYGASAHGEP